MTAAPRRLLHAFSTFAVGGPQIRFAALANALGARYRHAVLAMDGDYAAAERLNASVDIELLSDFTAAKNRTLSNVLAFRRALARLRPDLLVTYNWGAIEWALANTPARIAQIHVEDGFGPEEAGGQLARRVFARRAALAGKTVVVASRQLETLARERWRLAPSRIRFIANGVDVERFARAPDPAFLSRVGAGGAGPLIGCVAALRREKNLPRLIEAFAAINARLPCRLAIVGEGPEREAAAARAQALGVSDRVFFTGAVSDPADALGAFDLFMLASDTEQMPISVIEAMAAGLAVAATDVGDLSRMLSAPNRAYLTPADPASLAEAALALLADAARRRELGEANRQKCAEDYSFAAMCESWRRLWDGAPD